MDYPEQKSVTLLPFSSLCCQNLGIDPTSMHHWGHFTSDYSSLEEKHFYTSIVHTQTHIYTNHKVFFVLFYCDLRFNLAIRLALIYHSQLHNRIHYWAASFNTADLEMILLIYTCLFVLTILYLDYTGFLKHHFQLKKRSSDCSLGCRCSSLFLLPCLEVSLWGWAKLGIFGKVFETFGEVQICYFFTCELGGCSSFHTVMAIGGQPVYLG